MDKTTVVITTSDGTQKTFSGDTAIVITVENANEFLKGKVEEIRSHIGCIGKRIPDPLVSDIVAKTVSELIEKMHEGHSPIAAAELHEISELLEKREKELVDKASLPEMLSAVSLLLKDLVE